MPGITPPLSFSAPWGGWLCAGVVGGFVGGVTLVLLIVDLLRAPEGYEDDAGFHVMRREDTVKKKNGV